MERWGRKKDTRERGEVKENCKRQLNEVLDLEERGRLVPSAGPWEKQGRDGFDG